MAQASGQDLTIKPGITVLGDCPTSSSSFLSRLSASEDFVDISSSLDHSILVSASGRAYIAGKNPHRTYVAGKDDTGEKTPHDDDRSGENTNHDESGEENPHSDDCGSPFIEPTLVTSLAGVKVTSSACGHRSSYYLTDQGQVYVCGLNDRGQLGLGNTRDASLPLLVPGLPRIRQLSSGDRHAAVLSEMGEVWVAGRNDMGQLGLGHRDDRTSFTRVLCVSACVQVACGGWHAAIVTASGELYMTGWNEYNQLNVSPGVALEYKCVLSSSAYVRAASCGSLHTAAITLQGRVLVWGWGYPMSEWPAASPSSASLSSPAPAGRCRFSEVYAGARRSALVSTERDAVLLYGRLGGHRNVPATTCVVLSTSRRSLVRVRRVAFAEGYTLVLATEEGESGESAQRATRRPITEVERRVLRVLECPVCACTMRHSIRLCLNGHSVCGGCHARLPAPAACPICREPFGPGRNIALQDLAADGVLLPCLDCAVRLPGDLLQYHACRS